MKHIRFVYRFLSLLNREAALDSLRNILAVIGLGVILADFSTMRYWFMIPAAVLFVLVWAMDYLRHDFSAWELAKAENCRKELSNLEVRQ